MTKPDTKPDEKKAVEEEDDLPKVSFTPVTEEGAVYSKRYVPATRLKSIMLLTHPHVACKTLVSGAAVLNV